MTCSMETVPSVTQRSTTLLRSYSDSYLYKKVTYNTTSIESLNPLIIPFRGEHVEVSDHKNCIYCGCQGFNKEHGGGDTAGPEPSGSESGNNKQSNLRMSHRTVPEARRRNFLHGHLSSPSLMGEMELDSHLHDRNLNVLTITWNLNGQGPQNDLRPLVFPDGLEIVPELVIIGTQEGGGPLHRTAWEVGLQEALGPLFVLLSSSMLGALHLSAFIRRELIWFCSEVEDNNFSLRPAAASSATFRTKGGIGICFMLFGTSMMFVSCHLSASVEKCAKRVQEIEKINTFLGLPNKILKHQYHNRTQNGCFSAVDSCLLFGDMNFRLNNQENIKRILHRCQLDGSEWDVLTQYDQLLTTARENSNTLKNFKEALIDFPPTYKFNTGTDVYDTSAKKRIPAYTDRILYQYGNKTKVECQQYDSITKLRMSDHRPVWARFTIQIRPGKDSISLGGGRFNRSVYLQGMARRLNSKKVWSFKNSMKPAIGLIKPSVVCDMM